MPIARFQMPDGRVARFEVPEGTTPEQAQELISQHVGGAQKQSVDPTDGMGTLDKLLAGVGAGMTSAGRAALQGVSKLIGADSVGAGLVSQKSIDEARQIDAPLMATTAGKVGNVIGRGAVAAPTMLIPGANTYAGAGMIGAGVGGLTTDGGLAERLRGAAIGGAGGMAGKGLGDALGAGARFLADRSAAKLAATQAATAPRMSAAQAAADAGYVIPPADLRPGVFTEALSGLSGKIKTAQVASQRNQGVTNDLAKRALGIADDAPITPSALQTIRAEAGTTGYAPIRAAGEVKADGAYTKALDAIAGQYQGAARSFPGAAKNPVLDMVDGLRQSKFDAGDALDMIKVLRETADQAYRAGNTGLGKASKAAASALEDQIGRHLTAAGNPQALAAFNEARTTIAKTYSVQKALNGATGDVSAQTLARELAKGRPLSNELRTIAEVGQAFPKATQALKEAPKATSPLDWAVGAMTGASTGNPLTLAMIGARPAARSLLLSPAYQRAAMAQQAGPGLLSRVAPEVLNNELLRRAIPGQMGLLSGITSE